MKLRAENDWTRLVEATDDERLWLDGYLSFDDRQRFFQAKRYGHGDGRLHLFDACRDRLPSGLAWMVRAAAEREGLAVDVDDVRVDPCPCPECAHEQGGGDPPAEIPGHLSGYVHQCDFDNYVGTLCPDLRDYQRQAVSAVLRRTRGLIKLPTGAGKTAIAVALTDVLPVHWLFLVHRQDLLRQTAGMYRERTARDAGHVGEGTFAPDPERRFTVATYQTLAAGLRHKDRRALDLLADVEGVVCDEAHTCSAGKFWAVAMCTRRAYYRIGLSATPLARGDRRSVYTVAALGPIIYELKPGPLIEAGVLSRPIIRLVTLKQTSSARTWQGAYNELVVRSDERNRLVLEMCARAARPMLVFVKHVEHGHRLCRWLNSNGLRAEFQWGASASAAREAAARRLRFGEVDVVVCSVIWQEGIDLPELAAVVNAAGMRSTIAAVQRVGRGMRSCDGQKPTFEVWDLMDRGNPFVERHALSRVRALHKEGHEIRVLSAAELAALPIAHKKDRPPHKTLDEPD